MLAAEVRALIERGGSPQSEEAGRVARRWISLLTAYAGTDPSTQQKIRWADE